MDLARAFTKRSKRPDISMTPPTRVPTIKHNGPIQRSTISHPIELISTTNILAFNAPSIHSSPSSDTSSAHDSDSSFGFPQSSRGTSPDNSSVGSCPSPVEPNHLSSYFQSPGHATSSKGSRQSHGSSDTDVPAIPSRALSHTKKSHQALARQRSLSRSIQPPNTIHNLTTTRSSLDIFSGKADAHHPFSAELDQVNELAEEIGARNVMILDHEEEWLMTQGLFKYGAEEYVEEIQGLFGDTYGNPFSPLNIGWI